MKLNRTSSFLAVLCYIALWVLVIVTCGSGCGNGNSSSACKKAAVIDFFYADWCTACHKQEKMLPALFAYAKKNGYAIVINRWNVDTREGAKRYRRMNEKFVPLFFYTISNDIGKFSGKCYTVNSMEALLR